jgi:hypothetical protein
VIVSTLSLTFRFQEASHYVPHVLAGDSEHAGDVREGPIDETRGAVHSHSEASSSESAPLGGVGGQFRLELPDTIPEGEEKREGEWRAFHPSLAGVAAAPQDVDEQGGGGSKTRTGTKMIASTMTHLDTVTRSDWQSVDRVVGPQTIARDEMVRDVTRETAVLPLLYLYKTIRQYNNVARQEW